MNESFFTILYKGELCDVNATPSKISYNRSFNKITGKVLYYNNFVSLSELGSILRSDDIIKGSLSLYDIMLLLGKYPDLLNAFGNYTDNLNIFICQGCYTDPEVLTLCYNLPCI